MRHKKILTLVYTIALVSVGCAKQSVAPPPAPVYPVSGSGMPLIIDNGGPVLTNPRFVSITFPTDSFASQIDTFISKFGPSAEWNQMVSEYGVGQASVGNPVHLSESAPTTISDSGIQSWLTNKFNTSGLPLGAEDPNTIYVIYYPQSTTIAFSGMNSCTDFAGYHSSYQLNGKRVTYAVIARCSTDTINDTTSTSSHELVEAATDPDVSNSAYGNLTPDNSIWDTLSFGAETGDMCQRYASSYYVPASIGFQIQKSWSNSSAGAGKDPCVPVSGTTPYFNAAPVFGDTISYKDPTLNNQTRSSKGVRIPVGQTKTIELDVYSSGATTGPIQVTAFEDGSASNLTFTFDKTTALNGDKIYLTIKVNSQNAKYNAEPFWIKSTYNGVSSYWAGLVGN